MGITAISGFQNAYAQNHRDIPSWEKAVNARGIATMRGYHLSNEDRLRRAVINRLLCHTVVLKDEISREFSIDFDKYFEEELRRLEPFREDGWRSWIKARFAPLGSGGSSSGISR